MKIFFRLLVFIVISTTLSFLWTFDTYLKDDYKQRDPKAAMILNHAHLLGKAQNKFFKANPFLGLHKGGRKQTKKEVMSLLLGKNIDTKSDTVTDETEMDPIPETTAISFNKTYIIPQLNYSSMPYYINKSVIFMGMINNAQDTLPRVLQQINEVTCLFRNTIFILFESNSIDNTTQILHNWSINDTLKSNNGSKMEYCHNIDNTQDIYPNLIYKHMIYGDNKVSSQLEYEARKRSNNSYVHNLTRVEKFVPYRNMLLSELYNITSSNELLNTIDFDYIFMIDLDVWEIDFYSFLSELIDCPDDIMCINGVEWYDTYRDSYATVEYNHNWIHRPYIRTKKENRYLHRTNGLRKAMPRSGKRYELLRSCFNGLTAYKMQPFQLKNTECKYYLNNDIVDMFNNNMNGNNDKDFEWLYELNRLIKWSNSKGLMYDTDSGYETNLCEHISFHYCLNYRDDYSISVSRDAKLYYFPLDPNRKNIEQLSAKRQRRIKRLASKKYDPFDPY